MFTDVIKNQFLARKILVIPVDMLVTSSMVTVFQRALLVQISISYHICILRLMEGCIPPPSPLPGCLSYAESEAPLGAKVSLINYHSSAFQSFCLSSRHYGRLLLKSLKVKNKYRGVSIKKFH